MSVGWVLHCHACGALVEGEGPMWHTTQAFMCDSCVIAIMEARGSVDV